MPRSVRIEFQALLNMRSTAKSPSRITTTLVRFAGFVSGRSNAMALTRLSVFASPSPASQVPTTPMTRTPTCWRNDSSAVAAAMLRATAAEAPDSRTASAAARWSASFATPSPPTNTSTSGSVRKKSR